MRVTPLVRVRGSRQLRERNKTIESQRRDLATLTREKAQLVAEHEAEKRALRDTVLAEVCLAEDVTTVFATPWCAAPGCAVLRVCLCFTPQRSLRIVHAHNEFLYTPIHQLRLQQYTTPTVCLSSKFALPSHTHTRTSHELPLAGRSSASTWAPCGGDCQARRPAGVCIVCADVCVRCPCACGQVLAGSGGREASLEQQVKDLRVQCDSVAEERTVLLSQLKLASGHTDLLTRACAPWTTPPHSTPCVRAT